MCSHMSKENTIIIKFYQIASMWKYVVEILDFDLAANNSTIKYKFLNSHLILSIRIKLSVSEIQGPDVFTDVFHQSVPALNLHRVCCVFLHFLCVILGRRK